jgi:hypothetical protein
MLKYARFFPLLLAASLYAQPADPGGWNNIKWGMTLAGIRALYPAAVDDRSNPYWINLALPAIKIGGVPFGVTASAPKGSDKITQITLDCFFSIRLDPRQQLCGGPSDFETLKTLLLQKYGRQKNEEHKVFYNDRMHLFLWVFPSTSIELQFSQDKDAPLVGGIGIKYRALDPRAAGLL